MYVPVFIVPVSLVAESNIVPSGRDTPALLRPACLKTRMELWIFYLAMFISSLCNQFQTVQLLLVNRQFMW